MMWCCTEFSICQIKPWKNILRNRHLARLTFMAHFTGNQPINLCYKLVDWFLFRWARWRRVGWRLISWNVLVEVLRNWHLAHVTLMDRLTENLSIDLCCKSIDWFLFEWAIDTRWNGAYFVEWFAKHEIRKHKFFTCE